MPAGLPSSQRYAPQRLPIGSCPTYGGQAAVQPRSDPQASPSATCQGAARKGWKSASSSHLTLRRNGASSGPAGTSAAPSLLGVLTQGRRCKKQRAGIITSATPSASCPSSTYWGYGPAGRRARARQPALSLRGPPQHDLKCDCAWDRSSCRRTRARRPGSRRGQALSWPARARPRPCQIQLWWPTQLLRRVQDGARACAGRRLAQVQFVVAFSISFLTLLKKCCPPPRYGRLC